MISNSRMQINLLSFLFKKFKIIKKEINIKDTLKLHVYAVLFSCFIYGKGRRVLKQLQKQYLKQTYLR
jgi:hypothetical protein